MGILSRFEGCVIYLEEKQFEDRNAWQFRSIWWCMRVKTEIHAAYKANLCENVAYESKKDTSHIPTTLCAVQMFDVIFLLLFVLFESMRIKIPSQPLNLQVRMENCSLVRSVGRSIETKRNESNWMNKRIWEMEDSIHKSKLDFMAAYESRVLCVFVKFDSQANPK